jgi:hypothetical protein
MQSVSGVERVNAGGGACLMCRPGSEGKLLCQVCREVMSPSLCVAWVCRVWVRVLQASIRSGYSEGHGLSGRCLIQCMTGFAPAQLPLECVFAPACFRVCWYYTPCDDPAAALLCVMMVVESVCVCMYEQLRGVAALAAALQGTQDCQLTLLQCWQGVEC